MQLIEARSEILLGVVNRMHEEYTNINARRKLPEIPEDFMAELQQGMHVKSYWYTSADETSSAMQKAIRRGESTEAIQWALGLLWTSKHRATNVWTRLYVIATEDVGLGYRNASEYVHENYLEYSRVESDLQKALLLCKTVDALCKMQKCRAGDWACHQSIVLTPKELVALARIYQLPQYLVQYMLHSLFSSEHYVAVCIGQLLYCISLDAHYTDIATRYFTKEVFIGLSQGVSLSYEGQKVFTGAIPLVKYYKHRKGIQELIWLALLAAAEYSTEKTRDIVHSCYRIAHIDRMRWGGESKLLWIHCILVLCIPQVDEDLLWNNLSSDKSLTKLLQRFYSRTQSLVGVPEYAIDKHTAQGYKLGRNLQHFIQHGAHLEHRDSRYIELDNYYLSQKGGLWDLVDPKQ